MTTALANTSLHPRHSPRYHVQLPVVISAGTESSKIAVPGLACEISQRGMALYGGIDLRPGDRMEIEFQTSGKLRLAGIIRNRSGFCFGLEFLDSMPSGEAISNALQPAIAADEASIIVNRLASWKTWLVSHRGDAALAIATVLLLAAFSAAGSQSTQAYIAQGKSHQPSLTLFERALVGFGLAEPPSAPLVAGNPNVQVWVDLHTALYYCPGADLYGKTPDGKFTTQRDAQLDQFEPAFRKSCN
jgi:hypothetical protein